jgi:hypothetical protein
MSLKDLEEKEQDLTQYELQLLGQQGKRSKVWYTSGQRLTEKRKNLGL